MQQYNPHSANTIALAAFLAFAALLAVILRFVARSKTKAKYGADDWWSLASMITFLPMIALFIWTGADPNYATLPLPALVQYLKLVYVIPVLAPLPLTAAKFSILCLYRRLFKNDKGLRIGVNIVGVLCLLWFIAATVAVALKCIPVEKSWYPEMPGTCFNFSVFMVAIECPNSFLDFVMVALPVRVIRALHLSVQRKVIICFIFVLGGFVGVIGFIRIALVYNTDTLSMDQLGIWLMAQLAIAVICTCLPTYGPFLLGGAFLSKNLQGWYTSIVSLLGRVRGSSHLGSKTGTHPASDAPSWPHDNHYRRFSDTGDRVVLTRVVGGGNDPYDRKVPEQDYKMDGIKIRSEVEIA